MARHLLTILGSTLLLVVLLGAVWLWGFGGAEPLLRAAAEAQREAQNAMAQGLRALKGGQPGAWWSLMGVCFAYGFFHAAGPGHGKLVIGGYGLGRAVTLWRLSGLAVASSLAQAASAVILVLAGVWLFDWGRERLTATAEDLLAPVSYGLMALLGLYLLLRGLRRALRLRSTGGRHHHADHGHVAPGHGAAAEAGHAHHQTHRQSNDHPSHDPHTDDGHGDADHHHHGPGAVCASCGHRHGPTLEEAANLSSWREAVAIILSIAARPCTGAVFLLLLTWRLDVLSAGVAGTFAMGVGTACVTLCVALVAAGVRGGVLARVLGQEGTGGARLAAALEVCAGGLVLVLCLQLLMRSM
ncbi:nickel/cobalt transporter [Tritonibacter scottomollicae]|uniref:nickel/cobalt transporter n=1 Tax=Tritonibacter scottomollicae TaxID=483013 RepID=UPI003AA87C11